MKTWIIEPRDPLIARDGRPFTADPGARAKSLPFPFPSTTAGTVRTRYGYGKPDFTGFDEKLIEEVKKIQSQGPLLVELDDAGEIQDWLLPAPSDAALFEAGAKQGRLKHLVPLRPPKGAHCDLPDGLLPVGFASYDPEVDKQKPLKNAPRFWRREMFSDWLGNPHDWQSVELDKLGHGGPVEESRVHVKIDPKTQAADEGFLYQTSGLEFTRRLNGKPSRLALAVRTSAALPESVAPLGGEQRLTYWRESSASFPACPHEVRARIKNDKACRVVLLTPAHFRAGFRPGPSGWLLQSQHGVTPKLEAAAVGRPQVVSGWDYERTKEKPNGQPKPTRRLAPAGSVFFLKLDGDEQNIDQWIDAVWMNCVSDDDENGNPEQTRLDGFGLAALGVWSGEAKTMEVNK
jgi:CRISPR-associated protein Cmr3